MPKSEQQQRSHNHIINNNWKWRKSAKLVSAGLTKAARLRSLTLTHSQPAAISQSDDTPFGIPRQCKNKKKKNREKHQQKQKNTKISNKPTPTAIATGRWFPPGVRRVYALAPTMVSLSVISMRNEQFMNSTPHSPHLPPLYICTVIAKRPFHLYLCSLSVSPSPSLSLSFFRELSDEERAHIEIRFEFNSNRCTLLIYQHFYGICDAFLRNYLCIIRLFEIFVSSTHSITLRYLCLHGPFLCLIECVSISYLFGEYLPRTHSHKRVLRSSCLA